MRPASAECRIHEIGTTAKSDTDLHRMATAAWHKRGIATINPADVRDDFERQAIINAANRLYGKRHAP